MANVIQLILRFGPLVAAFALGLAAVLEPLVPGYTGILNMILSALGMVGIQPDPELVQLIGGFAAGVVALIGVARKVWSILKAAAQPK